jgi:probable rRNA maturation factor
VLDNALGLKVEFKVELLRVLVHGVLHLCGYHDKSDKEIKVMRAKEDCYLSRF